MLNPHRSSGDRANDQSFKALKRAGINIDWSNPAFAVTHEKSIGHRRYGGSDRHLQHVRPSTSPRRATTASSRPIPRRWTRSSSASRPTGSASRSRPTTNRVCCGAPTTRGTSWPGSSTRRRTIWSSSIRSSSTRRSSSASPRRASAASRSACCAAASTASASGTSSTPSPRCACSRELGVKVRRQKHLKLHAKLLIIDGKRAQVGSMNIDRSAFDLRRELGVLIDEPHIIKGLAKVFDHDWHESKPYSAPDPAAARYAPRRRTAARPALPA